MGRLEVYHDGQWGTVCDDSWDDFDAAVVCRHLGYSGSGIAYGSAHYGEGSGKIWLHDISCNGSESSIENCGHGGWGQHDCEHEEDAGVSCQTVRLVEGLSTREGRVEIYHDGQWGTVCDDYWDDNDASVVCRQLGYGSNGSAYHSAEFGQGSGPIWLDDINCSGNEDYIENCQSIGWGVHNCGHSEDAGVYCGTMRLVGGVGAHEGRVEINHDGQWGTICNDSWDNNDASVVCRQLGFGNIGLAVHGAKFGQGSGLGWLNNVDCSGNEDNIESCQRADWGVHNCTHYEEAGVYCGTTRLVDGVTFQEGRVEIYHNGQWGTVCDDGWGDVEASVLCLQLGYYAGGEAFGSAHYGEGSGQIWLDDISCDGSETSIENCGHGGWGQHDCEHEEDAGARCHTVRLVGGMSPKEGRVEVYHGGKWGTICDDSWDDSDASVVCRQLGYGNIGTAFQSARFGEGSGKIWLDEVNCIGGEDHINDCENNGWGVHDCSHAEDASLNCGTVRLIGGATIQEGRVEVYHNGRWGTICDNNWDDIDASVVCKQLGYSDNGTVVGTAQYHGESSGQIWLDGVSCDGSENNIENCGHGGWGMNNCNHEEDAGARCNRVRLVAGTTFQEGRVEIYYDGQWGTICDDSWDDIDASVVCRQLKYGVNGKAFGSATFGQGSGEIWLDDVSCEASDDSVERCAHEGWGQHNCGHGEDAGVRCQTVRLVGGVSPEEGRVDIYHESQWGTICGDSWDDNDASVVCRQLGYGNVGSAFQSARFGQGSGPIWLRNVDCSGHETFVENCQNNDWRDHNCSHTEDASVLCGTLRLVGGTYPQEGRVEVYRDGQWGTICDDSWDSNDATVICRQLGYSHNRVLSLGNAYFGEGVGQIWLDDMSCSGSENNLENCGHSDWGDHNCGHSEDAGVMCATVRLVGGDSTQEGRVEVYHGNQWGTICDNFWDDNDASVVCRQLGYETFGSAFNNSIFGQGSNQIWLDNVACSGDEAAIENCQHDAWGDNDCGHGEEAGVVCGTMRLVGGDRRGEGRIEVYHDNQWGTICDDYWDSTDASVACRQMGYGNSGIAFGSAYFGEGSGPIWLDDVGCSGTERNIESCTNNGWESHNCGHGEDAGVRCSVV